MSYFISLKWDKPIHPLLPGSWVFLFITIPFPLDYRSSIKEFRLFSTRSRRHDWNHSVKFSNHWIFHIFQYRFVIWLEFVFGGFTYPDLRIGVLTLGNYSSFKKKIDIVGALNESLLASTSTDILKLGQNLELHEHYVPQLHSVLRKKFQVMNVLVNLWDILLLNEPDVRVGLFCQSHSEKNVTFMKNISAPLCNNMSTVRTEVPICSSYAIEPAGKS